MKQDKRIIMLPTNKEGALNMNTFGLLHIGHSHLKNNTYKNQHLYLLDKEIKELPK